MRWHRVCCLQQFISWFVCECHPVQPQNLQCVSVYAIEIDRKPFIYTHQEIESKWWSAPWVPAWPVPAHVAREAAFRNSECYTKKHLPMLLGYIKYIKTDIKQHMRKIRWIVTHLAFCRGQMSRCYLDETWEPQLIIFTFIFAGCYFSQTATSKIINDYVKSVKIFHCCHQLHAIWGFLMTFG